MRLTAVFVSLALYMTGAPVPQSDPSSQGTARSPNAARSLQVKPASTTSLGLTQLVSQTDDEQSPNAATGGPGSLAVSAGGRYVAFVSSATNLVQAPTLNGVGNLFLRDLELGTTTLISFRTTGGPALHSVQHVAITPDGRFVVFETQTALTANDLDEKADAYLYRRDSHDIVLASLADDDTDGGTDSSYGASTRPTISNDGRYVAWSSTASRLTTDDGAVDNDVFVRDLQNGTTTLVSKKLSGQSVNPSAHEGVISGDGRHVAFVSGLPGNGGLVPGPDTNGIVQDAYLANLDTGAIKLISRDYTGAQSNTHVYLPRISYDGGEVAFQTAAALLPTDTNGNVTDAYVYSAGSDELELVSISTTGVQEGGASVTGTDISDDGTMVAWTSRAHSPSLMVGDTNQESDAYVRDLEDDITFRASVSEHGRQLENGPQTAVDLSSDGQYVAFDTDQDATDNDNNDFSDYFVTDVARTRVAMDRLAQSFGLGSSIYALNPTAVAGDPVNTLTGSFVTSVQDLALPGVGLPFVFGRAYNSANENSGPFGRGWSASYNTSLSVSGGTAILHAEDGQQIRFQKNANGVFVGDPGTRAELRVVTVGYVVKTRDRVEREFDTQGRLTQIKTPNNDVLSLTYATGGGLQTITDTVGRVINVETTDGRITKVTLPDGRYVSYGYTGGLLTSARDVRGNTTGYTYDSAGRLEKVIDQNLHTMVRNVYGAGGRVVEQYDANGKLTTFSWDPATGTATMTDARLNQWKDIYSHNVLIQRIDPLGNKTSYQYDSDLNLVLMTDPAGFMTKLSYDARGNILTVARGDVLSKTPTLEVSESYTYNSMDHITSATDARQKTTTYQYDTVGNTIGITQPGNISTVIERKTSSPSLVASVTDPRGKQTTFGYDPQGNLTSVKTPRGAIWAYGYDSSGRQTSVVDPRGNELGRDPNLYKTTYEYNPANQVVSVTDALGNRSEWNFGPTGNLMWEMDANLDKTVYTYDDADRLKTVLLPGTSTPTEFIYDAVGNLASRVDPKGNTITYTYDTANRIKEILEPLAAKSTYSYLPNGLIDTATNPKGNATSTTDDGTTSYTYDILGRIKEVEFNEAQSDAATPDVGFTYDENSLDDTVETFVGKYRKGSIWRELGGGGARNDCGRGSRAQHENAETTYEWKVREVASKYG